MCIRDSVKEDAWYYEAVLYAMQEGYFKGVTATTFAPESKLSRAMAVTVLYLSLIHI